jgi:ferritin-like protein
MAIHIKPATKVSEKLTKMLNEAIAREIAVGILYMWEHVLAIGVKGIAVQNQFRQTAITEMKHAEAIAERLWYLGGVPPTQPSSIPVGPAHIPDPPSCCRKEGWMTVMILPLVPLNEKGEKGLVPH